MHWRETLGILGYVRWTSSFGITSERGTVGGLIMQVFADADYASKAAYRRSVSEGLVMCGVLVGLSSPERRSASRVLQQRQST